MTFWLSGTGTPAAVVNLFFSPMPSPMLRRLRCLRLRAYQCMSRTRPRCESFASVRTFSRKRCGAAQILQQPSPTKSDATAKVQQPLHEATLQKRGFGVACNLKLDCQTLEAS
jgi:hypothetical protein